MFYRTYWRHTPKPKDDPDCYLNRKKFHSIVLEGICDHELLFTNINCGFPGSVHDRVFRNSGSYQACKNQNQKIVLFPKWNFFTWRRCISMYWLACDSIQRRWKSVSRSKTFYLKAPLSNKSTHWTAFGLLKGRFRNLNLIHSGSGYFFWSWIWYQWYPCTPTFFLYTSATSVFLVPRCSKSWTKGFWIYFHIVQRYK